MLLLSECIHVSKCIHVKRKSRCTLTCDVFVFLRKVSTAWRGSSLACPRFPPSLQTETSIRARLEKWLRPYLDDRHEAKPTSSNVSPARHVLQRSDHLAVARHLSLPFFHAQSLARSAPSPASVTIPRQPRRSGRVPTYRWQGA